MCSGGVSVYCCCVLLQVYDTLVTRGVPPHISQFNSLMEQYALRFQLGSVVSVLTTMIAGGVQPNTNTFRCVPACACVCLHV